MNRSNQTTQRAVPSRRCPAALSLLVLLLLVAPAAVTAQKEVVSDDQGVAKSGMGQGEALINVRSDIKLGIKGTRGTKAKHLEELTEVISDHMGAVRACYSKIVKQRPATVGSLALRVTLDPGEKPQHEFKEQDGSDGELTSCIRKIFTREGYKRVTRPAAAIVTLEFQNTRAEGQAVMAEHRQDADAVPVRATADGGFEASYTNPDERVTFHVSSKRSERAVEATTRTLRDSFAAFLDCRRRAQKGGLSPAGDVAVQVRLKRGGSASGKVRSSTVAHERVIPCVERAFRRLKFEDAPAGQRVDVLVKYAE